MVNRNQIILCFLAWVLYACSPELHEKEKFQRLDLFETIELNSTFQVYLIQDTSYSIRIEADKNVLENIDIQLNNGVLKISNHSSWKWLHPTTNAVKLYITSNQLKLIRVNETCHIETINPIHSKDLGMIMSSKLNEANLALQCSVFYMYNNHPTGGKVTVSGTTDRFKVWTTALMQVDARNLLANVALVDQSSKGDVHVRCTETLVYSIHNIGNIYYYGKPNKFDFQGDTGKGELIQAE